MPQSKYLKPEWACYHWGWYLTNHRGHRTYVDFLTWRLRNYGVIYDAGCGDGLLSFLMACRGKTVTGVDTDPEAIRQAKKITRCFDKMNKLHYAVESVEDYRTKADVVVCSMVIEHVKNPHKALTTFAECADKLLISTDDGATVTPSKYDERVWTLQEFDEELNNAGWHVTENHEGHGMIMVECER